MIKGHSFPVFVSSFGRCQATGFPSLEALQAEQALPTPDDIMDPLVFPREQRSPQPIGDGAEDMDVDAGEVDEVLSP